MGNREPIPQLLYALSLPNMRDQEPKGGGTNQWVIAPSPTPTHYPPPTATRLPVPHGDRSRSTNTSGPDGSQWEQRGGLASSGGGIAMGLGRVRSERERVGQWSEQQGDGNERFAPQLTPQPLPLANGGCLLRYLTNPLPTPTGAVVPSPNPLAPLPTLLSCPIGPCMGPVT